MLYLRNTTDAQLLMIPKFMVASSNNLSLFLKSTIDKESWSFDVTDEGTSTLYFVVSVTMSSDMPMGEYEYSLMEDGAVKSNGLLIVGKKASISEYYKYTEYEQYTTE